MAITKIWAIKNKLDQSISYVEDKKKTRNKNMDDVSLTSLVYYATNPKKTEKQLYVTGINCGDYTALEDMTQTKLKYCKTGGVKAFHAVQSFAKDEVTPEKAHEIGIKLAEEMWGDRFEVVVTTHLNTEHYHNHFIINSVSFKDGKKLYQDLSKLALLRHKSDELCLEYQLSVLREKPVPSGIDFDKFLVKYQSKNIYYEQVQQDIDRAIGQAINYNDFLGIMKEMDYEVTTRADKLSVRRSDRKRNIRIERVFGDRYSIPSIQQRIELEKEIRVPFPKVYSRVYKPRQKYRFKERTSALQRRYITKTMEYSLKKSITKVERAKLRKFSENTIFLCDRKIETVGELLHYKEERQNEEKDIEGSIYHTYYLQKKKEISPKDKEELMKKQQELKIYKEYLKDEIRRCNQVLEMNQEQVKEYKKKLKEKEKKEYEHGDRYSDERDQDRDRWSSILR